MIRNLIDFSQQLSTNKIKVFGTFTNLIEIATDWRLY